MNNHLLIQQAISLFDLLPCRTTELKIAGDWLEDHGLYSFMANVVRQGRWSSMYGFDSKSSYLARSDFYNRGHQHGNGNGNGHGRGVGCGLGDGGGYGNGSGHGDGHGSGSGSGDETESGWAEGSDLCGETEF